MKRIISLLVVMAMMLASVLAIIPVSATVSADSVVTVPKDEAETTRFLSESAYNAFKEAFEGGAATNAYVNEVTPFAFNQAEANAKFENKRILEITLPVKLCSIKSIFSVDIPVLNNQLITLSYAIFSLVLDESTKPFNATIILTSLVEYVCPP